MLSFNWLYKFLAFIILIVGTISLWVTEDSETFRYALICALLIDIYAEVSD